MPRGVQLKYQANPDLHVSFQTQTFRVIGKVNLTEFTKVQLVIISLCLSRSCLLILLCCIPGLDRVSPFRFWFGRSAANLTYPMTTTAKLRSQYSTPHHLHAPTYQMISHVVDGVGNILNGFMSALHYYYHNLTLTVDPLKLKPVIVVDRLTTVPVSATIKYTLPWHQH